MHRIEVGVKKKDLATFEMIATLIGRETKQKVMYVVINYQADVQLLFVDDEEPSPRPEVKGDDKDDEDDEGESPPQAANK